MHLSKSKLNLGYVHLATSPYLGENYVAAVYNHQCGVGIAQASEVVDDP